MSVHVPHTWAFFDPSLSVVDLAQAKMELSTDKKDTSIYWVALHFEDQDVYQLPSGRTRHLAPRAAQRDPALRR